MHSPLIEVYISKHDNLEIPINTIAQLLRLPPERPGQPTGLWPYAIPYLSEHLLPPIIRRFGATWDVKWAGLSQLRAVTKHNGWILASWHDALLMNMYSLRDTGMIAVVSLSWEGEIIASAMRGLGIDLARGSSGHQPMRAIRQSVRHLRCGETIGWVVDGPEGPRRQVKPGILHIASLSRKPILPMHAIALKSWNLPSWDRQTIPYPFTRICVGFGEPIHVPPGIRGAEQDEYSDRLENALLSTEIDLRQQMDSAP